MKRFLAFTGLMALTGCGYQGPSVAGYEGLQYKIISFYDNKALEENASCTQPRMKAIIRANVIEENAERVVMNVRYRYRDEGQTSDNWFLGGTFFRCNDWAERTFTMVKNTADQVDVEKMTGPQRR